MAPHNRYGDCWLIIHNKVYDVSKYMSEHPGGGMTMVNVSGLKNATEEWEDVGHSKKAIT